MNRTDWLLATVAAVSVLSLVVHGWAHVTIPVGNPVWQLVLVLVFLFVAPVAGVALLAAGRRRQAIWTLTVAGIAGLTLEGLLHFVLANPDHVASVETGAVLFTTTALLSTTGDALLALAAGWAWRRQAQGSSSSSSIASMR